MQLPDNAFNWLLWLFFEQKVWMVWTTTPIWWPALRVLLRRGRMPHPLAYIAISAALGYGLVAAVCLLAILPVMAIGDYLVPHLLNAGHAAGPPLQAADRLMTGLTAPLLFCLPFSAIVGSRALTRRWPSLCGR